MLMAINGIAVFLSSQIIKCFTNYDIKGINKVLKLNNEFVSKGLPRGNLRSRLVLFWNLRNEEEFNAGSCKLFYVVQ